MGTQSDKAALSVGDIAGLIEKYAGTKRLRLPIKIVTDTSDFFAVDYGNVLLLEGGYYLVGNYEREGRFGIDDEPKYWVRRITDLSDGSNKIVKMVFFERFTSRYGSVEYECVRSSKKEARILEKTAGHPSFMHGTRAHDSAGNTLRLIEYIKGKALSSIVTRGTDTHEEYYYGRMRGFLGDFTKLAGAIGFLHSLGETHGDIRRDHVIYDSATGEPRWIDFDYQCFHPEHKCGYDIAGLGNVLLYIAGGGDVTLHALKQSEDPVLSRLRAGDMSIYFSNRLANLRKMYPYISEGFNNVLLHFSAGTDIFYQSAGELMQDLGDAQEAL